MSKVTLDDIVAEFEAAGGEANLLPTRARRWYYRSGGPSSATWEGYVDFDELATEEQARAAVRKRIGDKRMDKLALWPAARRL